MPFVIALAIMVALGAWFAFEGPFHGRSTAEEKAPQDGGLEKAPRAPQADSGGVAPTGLAGAYDPGGGLRGGEPGRALRVRVVEEGHPDRGVPDARVNGWRIARVPPGGGMPPSDNLSDARARSDAEGRATIRRITRRAVYLQVTASGFTMARRTIPAADEPVSDVEIALARGTIVAGRVLRPDGSAAVGAQVRGTQPEQWGWVEDSHEAVTDSVGAFRLSGFATGSVSLRMVLHEGDAAWVGERTVEAGSVDAQVCLPEEPARRRVRLLVKGIDGSPIPSARWDAEDGLYLPEWRSSSHGLLENGEAVLPADPEVQWVTIEYPRDKDGASAWVPTIVGPLGARGGDVEVVATRGVAVTGTVRDDQGHPMADVSVFASPLHQDGEHEREFTHPLLMESTDPEGRFHIDVPSGRVEIRALKDEWGFEGGARVRAPADGIALVGHPLRRMEGWARHADGTPAPEAVLYTRGQFPPDSDMRDWYVERTDDRGAFALLYYLPSAVRVRATLPPTGPDDPSTQEHTWESLSRQPVVIVPKGRNLTVRIAGWPPTALGAARIVNGAYSGGESAWIVAGVATFDGIDPRAPLSVYCGPLPDGRIAYSPDLSSAGSDVVLPLVASRSIRGHVRGAPTGARADEMWADTTAFQVHGEIGPDGTFVIRGVPIGTCRVCAVFQHEGHAWAGSIQDAGWVEPVEVEVRPMDEPALSAWRVARPPP